MFHIAVKSRLGASGRLSITRTGFSSDSSRVQCTTILGEWMRYPAKLVRQSDGDLILVGGENSGNPVVKRLTLIMTNYVASPAFNSCHTFALALFAVVPSRRYLEL